MMLETVFFCLLSYLLGAIPTGPLCAKIFGLGNLREIGSGNIGATNVLRTGNKMAAFLTLIGDGLKGTCAVLLSHFSSVIPEMQGILFGAFAFLGHLYPVWMKFNGGKGVATYLGVLYGLNPILGIIASILWLLGCYVSKISSLGALNMAVIVPFIFYQAGYNAFILICLSIMTVLLIYKHRENIKRLIARTEPRINQK